MILHSKWLNSTQYLDCVYMLIYHLLNLLYYEI